MGSNLNQCLNIKLLLIKLLLLSQNMSSKICQIAFTLKVIHGIEMHEIMNARDYKKDQINVAAVLLHYSFKCE